jgi:hypothetical protein
MAKFSKQLEGQHEKPLKWPEGWPRTRLQDRETRPAWKKNQAESVASLVKELERLGATSYMITTNETHSEDSGVAVYFSLKPTNQYAWQEALGFIGEIPTVAQIDAAYMSKAKRVHPDGPTPDITMFHALTEHRDRARAWARGSQTTEHEKVMPCDAFKEQRWNINAIRLTIGALRQIERCGSPLMMERAFRGFAKQITSGVSDVKPSTVA